MTIIRMNKKRNSEPTDCKYTTGSRFVSERMIDGMVQSLQAEGYDVSKEKVRQTTKNYVRNR